MSEWFGGGKVLWHCEECCRDMPYYRRPARWLWVTVKRRDIENNSWVAPWWMGPVRSLRRWAEGTLTFTVIPFNVLLNLVLLVVNSCRYCRGDRWANALETEYNKGLSDGRGNVRIATRVAVAEARMEWEAEHAEDRIDALTTLGYVILAQGGEVAVPRELMANIPPNKMHLHSDTGHTIGAGATTLRVEVKD